jgi:hypothetical protein
MLIKFIQWFIDPLGYHILPKKDCIVVHREGVQFDRELCDKLIKVIIEHEPEVKDNVVRLDKYV